MNSILYNIYITSLKYNLNNFHMQTPFFFFFCKMDKDLTLRGVGANADFFIEFYVILIYSVIYIK